MNRRSPALAAFTAFLLAGCSLQTVSQSEHVNAGATRDAAKLLDQARQPMEQDNLSSVKIEDGVFTTASARRSDHGSPLPRQWERDGGFVMKRSTTMQLFEIGSAISDTTGIPVDFAPDVFDTTGNNGQGGQNGAATGQAPAINGAPGVPNLNSMLGSMGLSNSSTTLPAAGGNTAGASGGYLHPIVGNRQSMKVDFTGRLSDFLNAVSSHFTVSWEYSGGQIRIFKNETRTYTIHALPSSITLSSGLTADSTAQSTGGGGGSGGSSGVTGGSNQKVDNKTTVEIWKDITNAINTLVGSYGKVTTSVSTGTVTVTAPASLLSKVETYIAGQNSRLAHQVTINVQVLNVSVNDNDNLSFDLAGVLKDATRYGFSFGNSVAGAATTITQGTPGFGFNILNPTGTAGQLSGTQGIVNALSTKGKVTIKTTASLTTANGVPAPLQVANTRGYVQSITVTNGVTSGTGTNAQNSTITPGSVTTGFSLSLLPRIDPDGQGLLMQFGINIAELNGSVNGFDEFTSSGNTIQLPNVNSRSFVQQAFVPNGSTLVLAGFEQTEDTSTRSGMGNADFWALGGGQSGQHQRNIIVILMTPSVLSEHMPLITSD